MKIDKFLTEISLTGKNLRYKLNIIFAMFFLVPVFGFLYFAVKYDILKDEYVPIFFIGFLAFSFFGLILLRTIFDSIMGISHNVSKNMAFELSHSEHGDNADELTNIAQSFNALENRLKSTFENLEKNTSDISVLKELSDLCYATFNPEELTHITLERAMKIADANIGSVMILEQPQREYFIVKATIGLEDKIKLEDRIDFATSIAKYAVINKLPLIVENIETDSRFGRENRSTYGTKSFVCLPIKTSKEIIGVLTLSRKDDDRIFTHKDVEIVIPMLSNAAFTYENLRLMGENKEYAAYLGSMEKINKIINSSLRDTELMLSLLNEILSLLSSEIAIVMIKDESQPNHLKILEFMAYGSSHISKDVLHQYTGTILENVLKQGSTCIIDDTDMLSGEIEKELFAGHGHKTFVLAPLKTEGTVTGVLAVGSKKTGTFNKVQNLIEMISDSISLAVERNRLSTAVILRNHELDTLKQIGSALASSTFDMNQVLHSTMEMIREIMNVEVGYFLLLKGNELEFAVAFNVDIEILRETRIKIGQGISGYAAARGESIIVNDVQKGTLFYPGVDEKTGLKTKSVLCVPVICQGKVIGIIEVVNRMRGIFNNSDQQLLQSIASLVSVAMENARLYRETVSMADHERDIRQMFQKFVPKEIVDRITSGDEMAETMIEDFRSLTLLNVDIRGFSKLASENSAQKIVSILNYFFSVMGGIVFKHHGIVDKYLGDGFLAIFGAPVSSATDADNAISAALEMKQSIMAINDYLFKEFEIRIAMGVSIHTGEVIVGNIGFEKKMDYTVIGDAVNSVFRLQDHTKSLPNSVLITEKTLRAAKFRLSVREIGKFDIDSTLGELTVYELFDQQHD